MPQLKVFVTPDGAWGQYVPALSGLLKQPKAEVIRLSRIVPANRVKRWLFYGLRLFGDNTRLAAYTRTWRGPWIVDFSLSRRIYPWLPEPRMFRLRSAALLFEEQFATEILKRQVADHLASKPASAE